MRQIEDAHRRQVPIRDIEVSLSRAMLAFQRRNYQKAIKLALACDSELKERLGKAPLPLDPSRPRRPRREFGHPALRAHADPGDLDGGRAREDACDRRAHPQDPGLREQGSERPLAPTTPEEPVPEAELRACRDRLDDGPAVLLHA